MTKRQLSTLYTAIASILPSLIIMVLGALKIRVIIGYLGSNINGVYQVMMQLSSFVIFANIGLDSAFRISYYKLLEESRYEEVTEIYNYSVSFFKKVTKLILLASLVISIVSIFFVKDTFTVIETILLQFLLCLPNVTDFYIGNEVALTNARQKGYIYLSLWKSLYIIRMIISLFLIIKFENPILFLSVDAVLSALLNIAIGRILKKDNEQILVETEKKNKEPITVSKYILAFRISKQVFSNVDGLIISAFLSNEIVSVYFTYLYVANCLASITSYIISSFQNAMGSLLNSKENYKEAVINKLLLFVMLVILTVSVPLAVGMKSFVMNIWIGKDAYLIGNGLYILVVLYFSLYAFKYFVELLEDTGNVYSKTWKINIAEALTNIILSIVLFIIFGLNGIILATVIIMVFYTFFKISVICQKLNIDKKKMFLSYLLFAMASLFETLISIPIVNCIAINSLASWIISMTIVTTVSFLINFIFMYLVFKEFKYIVREAFKKSKRALKTKHL